MQRNSLLGETGKVFEIIREDYCASKELAIASSGYRTLHRISYGFVVQEIRQGRRSLPEKMTLLEALRRLGDGLEKLEWQHQKRIDRGDNPADADRETAQAALNEVATFLMDHDIESRSLVRLLGGLAALSAGSSAARMFTPAATRHRRPDAPAIEGVKGRLAAIMEFRQSAGLGRKAAGKWVVEHMTPELKGRLGRVSRAAVDSWLVKWGGPHGTTSESGREGYLAMCKILKTHTPTEKQWKKVMDALVKSLPS